MLEGHLHDRGQSQQHLIQFVKLVYYSPALSFSVYQLQPIRSIKKQCTEEKNMFTGPQTEMPQLFTMVVAYTGASCQYINLGPTMSYTYTCAHTPLFRQFKRLHSTEYQTCSLVAKKGLCDAYKRPITLFSMPFYTPRPPLDVMDSRGSALQYIQTHP